MNLSIYGAGSKYCFEKLIMLTLSVRLLGLLCCTLASIAIEP